MVRGVKQKWQLLLVLLLVLLILSPELKFILTHLHVCFYFIFISICKDTYVLHIHTRARHVKTNLHINSNVSTFQTAPLNGGTFRVITGAKSAGRYVI